jgi:hypothetical protein
METGAWLEKGKGVVLMDLYDNLGGRGGGRTPLGSNMRSQLDLHFFMNSLSAVSFSLGALET